MLCYRPVASTLHTSILRSITLAFEQETIMTTQEKQVVDLLEAASSVKSDAIAVISADGYIQHNLAVPDGLAGFSQMLASLPKGAVKVEIVRIFEDA